MTEPLETEFVIRSTLFPPTKGEKEEYNDWDSSEDFINPGLWAKNLALFLIEQLRIHGFDPDQDRTVEDWGNVVSVATTIPTLLGLAVGCANYHAEDGQDGDDDEYHLVFTMPDTGTVRRWFKTIDVSDEVMRLADTIQTIFETNDGIELIERRIPT